MTHLRVKRRGESRVLLVRRLICLIIRCWSCHAHGGHFQTALIVSLDAHAFNALKHPAH